MTTLEKDQPCLTEPDWLVVAGGDYAPDALVEIYRASEPQQVKKQAAKIVRPHIVAGVKPATIPPASIIDWAELERDAAKVSALLALWQEQMESLEDEEMLLMLMAA